MDTVAVVMSTYNGERFLEEQIDSILNQRDVEIELFIRDDGSSDNTSRILEDYRNSHDNIHIMESDDNIGITKSFFSLLKFAFEQYPDILYFSFADQDDYWMPEKLSKAVLKIKESKNEKGALYYSNKIIVDEELHEIQKEITSFYGDYLEILWKSLASGCTMAFNRRLVQYLFKYDAVVTSLHDSWLYRLSKCIGSDIVFDSNAYILYRQHEYNVCGRQATVEMDFSTKNIFGSLIRRLAPREHIIQNVIKEIYRVAAEDMDSDNLGYSEIVLNYDKSIKSKIKMLKFDGIEKRPFAMRILWINKVILNMI